MIGRMWMNFRIQLSENLQRVEKFLLTAQKRFLRFDESCMPCVSETILDGHYFF